MNDKIPKIIIAVIIILALVAGYMYLDGVGQQTKAENFDKALQNASAIDTKIAGATEKYNNQSSTNIEDLINTMNQDMSPKYSEEIEVLNNSLQYTSSDVEKQYVELEIKRLEIQSKNLNATVKLFNAIVQNAKKEKTAEEAQAAVNEANKDLSDTSNEINDVYTDIQTLLKQNPDFNNRLHNLQLEKAYYGEKPEQPNNNVTNNTTTPQ